MMTKQQPAEDNSKLIAVFLYLSCTFT